ncbi:MAG: hypothetical protein JXR69_06160 [Candidatus Delongbacteria bacterium]|nr:hypothetical protein [Candidatus Delongbacteria bacterium]
MKKFIYKIIFYCFFVICLISSLLYYFYIKGGNDLPAPYFSNSISFNEKIEFLKEKDLLEIQTVVIGSSMSLNNVDSKVMSEYFGKTKYLNLASWGFKISDGKEYISNMLKYFPDLRLIIISANFMDISDKLQNITVDYTSIDRFLNNNLGIFNYFAWFNLKYYKDNYQLNNERKKRINTYQTLDFDENGGALLDIDKNHINKLRWKKDVTEFDISDRELKNLESMIELLSKNNIRFVLVISPQRSSLIDSTKQLSIDRKIRKISSIVKKKNSFFINSYEKGLWDDSLYVDYAHFNLKGARKFTEFIVDELKKKLNER